MWPTHSKLGSILLLLVQSLSQKLQAFVCVHGLVESRFANEIGDKRTEGEAYHNLGTCYQSLGKYNKAISHLQEGLEIAKEIGNESSERAAYQNLGVCYCSLSQFDNAISHLQRGVEIAKEIREKRIEGAAYRILGACYQSLGQYDKAISRLQEGLKKLETKTMKE